MEESHNSHRTGAIVANILMIAALFMPTFSIMGKQTVSFWELTTMSLKSHEESFFFGFFLLISIPVGNLLVLVANKENKLDSGAYAPIGALLVFLYMLNHQLSSSFSLDKLIEYKVGFYIYLFSAIALIIIRLSWPTEKEQQHSAETNVESTNIEPQHLVETNIGSTNTNSVLSNIKTRMNSGKPIRFLPLDFMDSFEKKHFAQICGDNPLSADIARYSLVIGTATAYLMLVLLARFDIDSIYSLILAAVFVVGMACVFLLPVFKGTYAPIDKVAYCLFIILTAIICGIFGIILSSLVIIYIVVFLVINLIRKYVSNK